MEHVKSVDANLSMIPEYFLNIGKESGANKIILDLLQNSIEVAEIKPDNTIKLHKQEAPYVLMIYVKVDKGEAWSKLRNDDDSREHYSIENVKSAKEAMQQLEQLKLEVRKSENKF